MKALFAAMAKAFPEIEGATKGSENPAFKRDGKSMKYADLAAVVDAIKPALVKHNLFFTQLTHEQQGGVCVETVVCHESGDQMSFGKLFMPASKNDAQGYGSALSYARRYSLMTAFGVCPEDDDGNAAVATPAPPREATITAEQAATITAALKANGRDEKAWLAHYGYDRLSAIPREHYEGALKAANKAKPKTKPQTDEGLDDSIPHMEQPA